MARAPERPRLDGKLDDALWEQARGVELKSSLYDDQQWRAVTMLGYDGEYLYWASSCQKAPEIGYETPRGSRQRDANLEAYDRVELLIDIDRDWTTYFRLVVDQRGWASEDCWGDTSWNPEWFIAIEHTADTWTIEAAIPWNELTAQPPSPSTAWAVGTQRTVPDVGFQSWNTPAAVSVRPEGFGLMLFD